MNLEAVNHSSDGAPRGDTRPTQNGGALWTPRRFREHMAVSETTEAEWRSLKLIDHFKQGRNVRYEPWAIMEFIARHTISAGRRGDAYVRLESGQFALLQERLQQFLSELHGERRGERGERAAA